MATEDEDAVLEKWNQGLKLILNRCPSLEIFKSETDGFGSDECGAINMDFCGLKKLQKVELRMYEFEYYTMNQADKQGHRWKTFEKTFDQEPSGDQCYVNLSWNGYPSVILS